MEFPRHEYWSGLSFPPLGSLTDPGIEPGSLESPALGEDSLPLSHQGNLNTKKLSHKRGAQRSSRVKQCWITEKKKKKGFEIGLTISIQLSFTPISCITQPLSVSIYSYLNPWKIVLRNRYLMKIPLCLAHRDHSINSMYLLIEHLRWARYFPRC